MVTLNRLEHTHKHTRIFSFPCSEFPKPVVSLSFHMISEVGRYHFHSDCHTMQ